MITAEQILRFAPQAGQTRALALASELNISLPLYGATATRAHFMAEGHHETQGFTRFEENLYYSADRISEIFEHLADRAGQLAGNPSALANAAYANRMGNGGEETGDGWRYRGRGIFQLTGRANYAAAGAGIRADLVGQPDLLLQIRFAVESALWFWRQRCCIQAAARDDVEAVTRAINGGLNGLDDRIRLTNEAKEIFTT